MEAVLYSVAEAAELLKVNKNAVYELIRKKVLIGLKLGSIKITKTELMRFLEENTGKDLTDLDNIKELNL